VVQRRLRTHVIPSKLNEISFLGFFPTLGFHMVPGHITGTPNGKLE